MKEELIQQELKKLEEEEVELKLMLLLNSQRQKDLKAQLKSKYNVKNTIRNFD